MKRKLLSVKFPSKKEKQVLFCKVLQKMERKCLFAMFSSEKEEKAIFCKVHFKVEKERVFFCIIFLCKSSLKCKKKVLFYKIQKAWNSTFSQALLSAVTNTLTKLLDFKRSKHIRCCFIILQDYLRRFSVLSIHFSVSSSPPFFNIQILAVSKLKPLTLFIKHTSLQLLNFTRVKIKPFQLLNKPSSL